MLKLGIEPKTFALLARRSNQLSYSGTEIVFVFSYISISFPIFQEKQPNCSPLSIIWTNSLQICPDEQFTTYLFLRNLNLTVIDLLDDGRGVLTVDGAADRVASSQNLLHRAGKSVGVGTLTENLGHLNDLIESDVAAVLNYLLQPCPRNLTVLVLLSVSGRLVELADDQRGSAGHNLDLQIIHNPLKPTVAWRLTTVSLTVIFRPFQSIVAFWISSPTFLGA